MTPIIIIIILPYIFGLPRRFHPKIVHAFLLPPMLASYISIDMWQICRNHASEPQMLANLLLKLQELKNLGAKHSAHLDWFRLNWAKLRLPPLFAEIFDIPKCEEDVQ
jgi:hypothetical protein